MRLIVSVLLSCCFAACVSAGEPGKNPPPAKAPAKASGPKRIPPEGVPVPPEVKTELDAGLKSLDEKIAALRTELKAQPKLLELLPDVEVHAKAVRVALQYNEFFDPKEFKTATELLKHGEDRAAAMKNGQAPWTVATGLVPRAYISKLDDSIIPYGLVVPASYQPGSGKKYRLDIWLHGREEKLSELKFVSERYKNAGEFTPPDTFVLHAYGRYCNAFKFAGEVDVFEALAHAKSQYPIDTDRLVIRGFSMGGGGCWHIAAHHPSIWAAAAPGAGFSETPLFSRAMNENPPPNAFEQKLWALYDATPYAVNFFNLPLVAYSGEKDRQIQAALVMEEALKAEGMTLDHVIGPATEHKYHPDSKKIINDKIDPVVAKGRVAVPPHLKFSTWTLRYNRSAWIVLDGLEKHWSRARVDAQIDAAGTVRIKVENVSAFTIEMAAGTCPLQAGSKPKVIVNDQEPEIVAVGADKGWKTSVEKIADRWVAAKNEPGLRKVHGLQGPIDDAFMDSFINVRPTDQPYNQQVGEWARKELDRSLVMWRSQFRGDARVVNDTELTDAQIAQHNLVLWGDPRSNKVLEKIAGKLPIQWTDSSVQVAVDAYPSGSHVLVMIFPNPLNPKKYVVLNSGFTFREEAMASNARQNAKLPDWVIIDTNTPPTPKFPGALVRQGFFNEKWQVE